MQQFDDASENLFWSAGQSDIFCGFPYDEFCIQE